MIGTSFSFSEEKIPVDSNVVKFSDFTIRGCNENPLFVNGTVDVHNLANVSLDLLMKANDMQIVKSDRPRGADVFGKAFIDLDAKVKGDMSFLNVDADARVCLHNEEGSVVNVYLSPNGSNRAQVLPAGDLTYTMSALNGDRITGRLNINGGYVRYTPPLMSEKNFQFQEGSYIAFNGDMLNPRLNIHAVDEMRANVTQSGQNSRLVNFDVLLGVTNTLQNMNVTFDLATNDDITVQNELASMSAEQRANQAMNLLLYNVYTGAGTKASANLSGNPLYSFLTSQINSWAANNIRGVDISFGIDQYLMRISLKI